MKEGVTMRKILYGFLFQLVVFSLCYSNGMTVAQEDTTGRTPDYKAVNVVVETEWGGPEKINAVDVFVEYEKKIPVKLEIFGKNNHCEIRIVSGMAAKIIDPKTGKILAYLKGPEEAKQK